VIAAKGGKRWKPIDARRMALLTNICTIIRGKGKCKWELHIQGK